MSLKLEITYELGFDIIGIVSSDKEYKLAWLLNRLLQIRLIKQDDIIIPIEQQKTLLISFLEFKTEHESIRLIKNRAYGKTSQISPYTLPELKSYDFFLLIENPDVTAKIQVILRNCSQIQYASVIDETQIKNKGNLFFD